MSCTTERAHNSGACSYVKDVLRIFLDRAMEQGIGLAGIHDMLHQVKSLHGLKLLLVAGSPVLALTDCLITATIFDVAGVY